MSVLEASPAQHRIWFLEQLDAGGPSAQTLSVCVRFDGRVVLDRLRLALQAVIPRHDVLRSVYRWQSDRLVAELLPDHGIEILETGSRTTPTYDENAVVRLARDLAGTWFDVARGPLLRALIVANGSEQAYLVLVAHRIICDDWSCGVLLREVTAEYIQTGAEPPTPAVGYWDYVEPTTLRTGGHSVDPDLAYWPRLDEVRHLPPIARDAPVPQVVPVIQRAGSELGREIGEEVIAYARARDVTPASVFAASLQALLYRLGFGEKSVLAVRLADRPARHAHHVIGCFLDTIVLRGWVRGGNSLDHLVRCVRDNTEAALERGGRPFEGMARQLTSGSKLLRNQLYQALLVIDDCPLPRLAIPGVQVEYVSVPRFRGAIDTTFAVGLGHAEPAIGIEWNGALTLPATRLIDSWLRLLMSGLRQPGTGVEHLSMTADCPLAADSTARPTARLGRGVAPSVPELLRARAEREPQSIALIGEGVALSLGELVQRSARVAERLRTAGVQTGNVVGLAAARSYDTIVATLGILGAGGVCVPLDTEYPAERLRFMLEDSGAAVVLTEDPRDRAWMGAPALTLDGTGPARVDSGARRLDASVGWVLYTSGSTGSPKGVLITHEMVVARLLREPIPWEPGERCCHKTPLNFIDSIWEMFGPAVNGVATVVADHETARDPRALARLVEREGVTRIVLVPSLLVVLLNLDSRDLARISGVRYWISSGEALPSSVAERFYRSLPGATLVNLYGASECWDATWCKVPDSVRAGDVVPIGDPLQDVSVWLLDEGLNPVPDDVPAELFVGGPCVSKGYLERPELAAGRFFPAALIDGNDRGVVFRTGDIACRRSDGSLEILGRQDLQLKLRGFRIEVEEIERRLRSIANVLQAAVVPRRDPDSSVVALIAFVVLEAGVTLDVAACRRSLGEQLPVYCVPNDFVQVESLPLTVNGKLDRAALEDRANGSSTPERTKRIHSSPHVEQALMQIWCDVLDLDKVNTNDDFFHLGGHSLLAVQVVLRIQDELAADLSLRDFYADPTVSGLTMSLTS